MKFRDLRKRIEDDGWVLQRTRGSHLVYRHREKPGTVILPAGGKMNRDVKPGTMRSVLKQAGLLP